MGGFIPKKVSTKCRIICWITVGDSGHGDLLYIPLKFEKDTKCADMFQKH